MQTQPARLSSNGLARHLSEHRFRLLVVCVLALALMPAAVHATLDVDPTWARSAVPAA